MPRKVSRPGTTERQTSLAPTFAGVAPGPAAPHIQQPLALRVEVEKAKHPAALRGVQWMVAADELVVHHPAVGQYHCPPCLDACPRAEWQARSQHHSVQQVAFQSYEIRHGAIVERARQGRDEVDVTGGSTFQKAAAGNLDHDLDLGRVRRRCGGRTALVALVVHCLRLPQPDVAAIQCRLYGHAGRAVRYLMHCSKHWCDGIMLQIRHGAAIS